MEEYSPLSDTSRTWIATQVCEPAAVSADDILFADHLLDSWGCEDYVNLCGVWTPREVGTCCGFPISQMGPHHETDDHETALAFLEKSRRSPSPPNPYTTGPWAISMDSSITNAAFRDGPWGPTISAETELIEPSMTKD